MSVSPGNLGGAQCSEGTTECGAQQATAQALLSFDSGLTLVQADNSITSNAYTYAKTLTAAVQSVTPLKTVFPANNGLASQLQQIAQIIQVRAALGVSRQIFFCGIGNFDTHSDQVDAAERAAGGASVPALAAFYNATVEMGVQSNVTTFTMSDFSRTFQPNSNTGSDHAWGSHHIVMGGAVKGGTDVRDVPDAGVERAGRFRDERAVGSDHRQRAVRGYAGVVVRSERGADADDLPEHRRASPRQISDSYRATHTGLAITEPRDTIRPANVDILRGMVEALRKSSFSMMFVLLLLLACTRPAGGYSVLTHEEIIDLTWTDSIRPLLLKRFPNLTPAQLKEAHAYAYGGCLIQDLGYYPFGKPFFSDLLHYVRTGDFVRALFRDSEGAGRCCVRHRRPRALLSATPSATPRRWILPLRWSFPNSRQSMATTSTTPRALTNTSASSSPSTSTTSPSIAWHR